MATKTPTQYHQTTKGIIMASVAQFVEYQPMHRKVANLIPNQGTYPQISGSILS